MTESEQAGRRQERIVMTAECVQLTIRSGQLVWEDYLEHRRLALRRRAWEIIPAFSSWRAVRNDLMGHFTDEVTGCQIRISEVDELIDCGVLKIRGSERDALEKRVLQDWDETLVAARAFHFATRTTAQQDYLPLDDARSILSALHDENPRPPLCEDIEGHMIDLAKYGSRWSAFGKADLISTLYLRRSVRHFDPRYQLPQELLGGILCVGAGAREIQRTGSFDDYFKRTSASGGALHPVDVYCYSRSVHGVPPAVYYFHPVSSRLVEVAPAPATPDLLTAVGGQEFFKDAALTLIFVANIRREFWKYRSSRAYRIILADFGHLAQTVALLSQAAGLGSVLSCALRDQMIERILGVDGTYQIPLGGMALGKEITDEP